MPTADGEACRGVVRPLGCSRWRARPTRATRTVRCLRAAPDARLRLSGLLALQQPRGDQDARDELLFITTHQTFELWFKQLLLELEAARNLMLDGEVRAPIQLLERAVVVQRTLLSFFDVLDTMAPQDFAQFRLALGSASGAQSAQFWEIALLSGSRDKSSLDRPWHDAAERARLHRRFAEPSLWDGFLTVLPKEVYRFATNHDRFEAYRRIGAARTSLWDLAEALVRHDQAWAEWQSRHLLTVERQIGHKPGTGGTAGVANLRTHLDVRFYPELWEMRARLYSAAPQRISPQLVRPKRRSALRLREPKRLPRALDRRETTELRASLRTWRDRGDRRPDVVVRPARRRGAGPAGHRRRHRRPLADGDRQGREGTPVPLDVDVAGLIQTYLLAERPETDCTALFVVAKGATRGQPLTPAGLRTIFRYHWALAGVTAGHPHALRHTCGTLLAVAGVDLSVMQRGQHQLR